MATLNDTSMVTVKDHALIERLIWSYQESTITPVELVSYGSIGVYALKLTENKGRNMQDGNFTGQYLKYYTQINPQEEVEGMLTGKVTGNVIAIDRKATVKFGPVDTVETFLESITCDSNLPMSDINKWQSVWRLALAYRLGFVMSNRVEKYRKLSGATEAKYWQFVLNNVFTMSPKMLRAQWEKDHTPKTVDASAKIAETAKTNSKAKVQAG